MFESRLDPNFFTIFYTFFVLHHSVSVGYFFFILPHGCFSFRSIDNLFS